MQRPFPAQGSFRHSSSSTTKQGRKTSSQHLQLSPASPAVQQLGRASAEPSAEDLSPMARRTKWAVEAQQAKQSNHQLPTYQCSGGGWGPRCNQGGTSSCIPLGSEHKHQLHRKGVRKHSH